MRFLHVCRCLRCVQGEPQELWSRVLMTRAVLPSGNPGGGSPFSTKSEKWVIYLQRTMSVYTLMFLRMDDKGEVKCIKFSIGNKILAVQRTLKSVVSGLTNQSTASQTPRSAAVESVLFLVAAGLHQLYPWLPSHRVLPGVQGTHPFVFFFCLQAYSHLDPFLMGFLYSRRRTQTSWASAGPTGTRLSSSPTRALSSTRWASTSCGG